MWCGRGTQHGCILLSAFDCIMFLLHPSKCLFLFNNGALYHINGARLNVVSQGAFLFDLIEPAREKFTLRREGRIEPIQIVFWQYQG
jgi:hypothetical protein